MASFKDPREAATRFRGIARLLTDAGDAEIVQQYARELEQAARSRSGPTSARM